MPDGGVIQKLLLKDGVYHKHVYFGGFYYLLQLLEEAKNGLWSIQCFELLGDLSQPQTECLKLLGFHRLLANDVIAADM